jgi:hypothetical protein
METKSFFLSFFNLTVVRGAMFFGEELVLLLITTTGDGTEPALNSLLLLSPGYSNLCC